MTTGDRSATPIGSLIDAVMNMTVAADSDRSAAPTAAVAAATTTADGSARTDVPPVDSANFLDKVRETLSVYLGKRGDPLDRGVTLRDLSQSGIVKVSSGYLSGGGVPPISGVGSAIPVSSGGGGGATYVPDLTPPPTPTGFTATAGLTTIQIQVDNPAYTAGHGHAKTRLYGVTYSSGALPTFSETYLLDEFTGPIAPLPTKLGSEWHLWCKWVSVDGQMSVTPAGGVNGLVATTGKIGNADLNDLIITAGKLADGSVSGTKLAANAIDATKLASGIEPVTVVSSVPGAKSTSTVFNTADGKLYRWSGSAYVSTVLASDLSGTVPATSIGAGLTSAQITSVNAAAVGNGLTGTQIAAGTITGSNLVANTITAGQIAANTITASQIAANTITAGQIAANTITAGQLAANTITAGQIAAGAINAAQIAAGAINAAQIAAGAIAVGSAAIQNGAIVNAMIGSAQIDDSKISTLSAGKLTAGTIAVGQYIRSTGYSAGSAGWTINGDGSCEFGAGYIRGQLVASQIDTRNLSIKDGSGNVIFAAGTNLASAYITPAASWLNSNVTLSSSGVLSGAGGGTVSLSGLGAGPLATVSQITSANASTCIASAAIGLAQINTASITNLAALTATIGTLRTATTGARMEISDNVIKVYDSTGVVRVQIGDLTL